MYLFRKFILWLIPITWVVGFELLTEYHGWWWLILAVLSLQQMITIFFVCKKKLNKNFLHFLILPILFSFSSWLFSIFITEPLYYHISVVVSGLLLYILIHQYYLYFYIPFRYQPYSLETMSLYVSLITVFFLFSVGFGGVVLLQMNVWLISVVSFVVLGLVVYQYFWINKLNVEKNWYFILIISLILAQVFIAVSYLPTGYYVNGFVLAVAFYLMIGFSKGYLMESLTRQKIWTYLLVGGLSLLAVLISARWG